MLQTTFGSGQGFTYSQNRIGNYYLDYLRIMEHWDKVLPGKVHRVIYEDMIEDTENEIKKLLNFVILNLNKVVLIFIKLKERLELLVLNRFDNQSIKRVLVNGKIMSLGWMI